MNRMNVPGLIAGLVLTAGAALAQPLASPFERVNRQLDAGERAIAKIVNGEPASIADSPWQVSLVVARAPTAQQGHFCGGSIIHPEWVITAAHCVDAVRDVRLLQLVSGAGSLTRPGHRSRVARIILHPQWDRDLLRNDIALLQIDTTGPALQGRPVSGPDAEVALLLRFMPVRVTGWGVSTQADAVTPELQGIELPVVPPELCATPGAYGETITPQMLCLGTDKGDQGSCNGDSGGPATVQLSGSARLVGLVSFGRKGCRGPQAYSVFTRVASYVDWVRQSTGGAVDWR